MKKLIILTLALAFCLPAYAELFVFQTTTTGQQLDVQGKIVERKQERGYFVINADLSNLDSVTVAEAYYLHYENKAGAKTQYTTILDSNNMELILVNRARNKTLVIRWFDDPTGTYTLALGTATLKDIGGLQRYVATSFLGNSVWREQDFRTGAGTVRLRFNIPATRTANVEGKTAEDVIGEYELAMQAKGYNAE